MLLQATNRLAEAEPLFRRALAIHEASYGPDHPAVATDLNNLAVLLAGHQPPGRGRAAVPPSAGDPRGVVRPRPPRRRHRPQQPGAVARGHQPPGRGRAAATAGRWRSTRRRTAPTTPTVATAPQQPGVVASGHQPPGRGRAAASGGRWRSTRRRSAPTTPPSPPPSTTWRCCLRPPTAWPRPSRCSGGRWRSTSRRTAPTIPPSPSASTTWRSCCGPPTAWPRPSRSSGGRWRSTRRRTAPTTPPSPPTSTIWRVAAGHQPHGRGRAALPAGAGDRRGVVRPDHPAVATALNNLALLLRPPTAGRGRAAVPATGDPRGVVRPRPPRRCHCPQQPGAVLRGHQPPGRGRAALPAGAGDRRGAYGPDHPASPPTSTTWRLLQATNHLPRPSRCSGGVWRSTRRRTAPTTPTSPALNNLARLLHATNRLAEAEPLCRRRWRSTSVVRPRPPRRRRATSTTWR